MTSLQCAGLTYSSKSSICYGPRAFKGPDLPGSLLFRAEDLFFSFLLVDFFPPGADAGFSPQKRGGGGAAPSIGPRALETLATPLLYRQYHRTSSRPRSCTQLWVCVHDQVSMSQQKEDQSSCSLRFSVPCECILLHNRGLTGLGGPPWKCLAFQQMSLHTFLGEHCNTLLQPVVLWEYLMFLSATLFLLILKH